MILKKGKYYQSGKLGGEVIWKTLNFVLMLVMRFLSFKQTFWLESFKKHGRSGKREWENILFPLFILFYKNTYQLWHMMCTKDFLIFDKK